MEDKTLDNIGDFCLYFISFSLWQFLVVILAIQIFKGSAHGPVPKRISKYESVGAVCGAVNNILLLVMIGVMFSS